MSDLTLGQTMPLRPIKIVWMEDKDGECEWCGNPIGEKWAIEAAPIPEYFCSIMCVVSDTHICWSPSKEMLNDNSNS